MSKRKAEQKNDMFIKSICLLVKDYDKTIEFYKKLSFVVKDDVTYGENKEKRWVTLKLPKQEIVLSLGIVGENDPNSKIVGKQAGDYPFCVINCDDIQSTYLDLMSKGSSCFFSQSNIFF